MNKFKIQARSLRKDDPWSVESSSPAPAQKPPTPRNQWAGRLVLDPTHIDDLDREAAINEFARKMPREQAEAKAHDDYLKKQRVEASAHHLAGLRDARAAGDSEAAKDHAFMYGRHSQAIGRNPLDAPQPDVLSAMQRIEPTKKRFKPHRADQLAVEPDVITSAPPLSKGEVIQFPGNPKPTQEQARPAGVTPISGGPLSHDYGHLLPPHLKKAGWQLSVDKLPAGVPSVVARLKNRRGLLIGSGWHRANGDFATAGIAPQEHLLRALEEHGRLDKAEKSETMYCTACKDPLDKDGHCNVKSHWPLLDASKKKLDKAEADGVKKKPTPCRCPRWSFPHRTGSCAKK